MVSTEAVPQQPYLSYAVYVVIQGVYRVDTGELDVHMVNIGIYRVHTGCISGACGVYIGLYRVKTS